MTQYDSANRRTVLKTIAVGTCGGALVGEVAADTLDTDSFVQKAWNSTEVANIENEVGALQDQGLLDEVQKDLSDGRSLRAVKIQTDNGKLSYGEGYDQYGTVTSTSAQLLDYDGPSEQMDIMRGDGTGYRLLSADEQADAVAQVDEPDAVGAYVPSADDPYRITGIPSSDSELRSFYEAVDIETDDDGGSGGGGDHFEDPLASTSTEFTTQDDCFGEDADDVYTGLSIACMALGFFNPIGGLICGAALIALEELCSED